MGSAPAKRLVACLREQLLRQHCTRAHRQLLERIRIDHRLRSAPRAPHTGQRRRPSTPPLFCDKKDTDPSTGDRRMASPAGMPAWWRSARFPQPHPDAAPFRLRRFESGSARAAVRARAPSSERANVLFGVFDPEGNRTRFSQGVYLRTR